MIGRIPFERVLWLFPVVTALHNAEEAIWLPAWSARNTPFRSQVGALEFRFAVAVLTALAMGVTVLATHKGGTWLYAALGYAGAMLLNVLFPHVVASALYRGYTPGIVTAILCNLPVDGYVLVRAVRERHAQLRWLAVSTALVTIVLVASIPGLFWAARQSLVLLGHANL
jgi:hypothetical protein